MKARINNNVSQTSLCVCVKRLSAVFQTWKLRESKDKSNQPEVGCENRPTNRFEAPVAQSRFSPFPDAVCSSLSIKAAAPRNYPIDFEAVVVSSGVSVGSPRLVSPLVTCNFPDKPPGSNSANVLTRLRLSIINEEAPFTALLSIQRSALPTISSEDESLADKRSNLFAAKWVCSALVRSVRSTFAFPDQLPQNFSPLCLFGRPNRSVLHRKVARFHRTWTRCFAPWSKREQATGEHGV